MEEGEGQEAAIAKKSQVTFQEHKVETKPEDESSMLPVAESVKDIPETASVKSDPLQGEPGDVASVPSTAEPAKVPSQTGPAKVPSQTGPAKVPSQTGPAKVPSQTGPAKAPSQTGPAKVPSQTAPAKVPSQTGPAKVPSQTGPAKVPSQTGPAKVPSQTGPTKVQSQTGPAKVPSQTGPTKVPSQAEPTKVPSQTGPAKVQSQTEPAKVPSQAGPAKVPSQTGPAKVPSQTGPAKVPSQGEAASLPSEGEPPSLPSGGSAGGVGGRGAGDEEDEHEFSSKLDHRHLYEEMYGEGEERMYMGMDEYMGEGGEEEIFQKAPSSSSSSYSKPSSDTRSIVEEYIAEEEEEARVESTISTYMEGPIEEEVEEEEIPFISVFDRLDVPREVLDQPDPITPEMAKAISVDLGQIRLCWPKKDKIAIDFMPNVILPDGYLMNTNKEKVLLLYCENFRVQYHARFPNRKPLLLCGDNIVGQRKMVCTHIRPTTLPHPDLSTWQELASFLADHIRYEPIFPPTKLVST